MKIKKLCNSFDKLKYKFIRVKRTNLVPKYY